MELTALDLFSGIGGFSLAAERAGFRVLAQVEIDATCREYLASEWPETEQYGDIKTFDARPYAGVTLVMGGPPCQPASRAGKQRGAADDRWLWPEALRVIRECKPTWACLENPPGIGDVGLAGVLAELEAQEYEVRVFGLPAAAVGAPHQRMRYWIVAHANEPRRQGGDAERREDGLRAQHRPGDGGWRRVVFSSECDEDGNCPECGIDYADCPCPGPTQDGCEYRSTASGLEARPEHGGDTDNSVGDACSEPVERNAGRVSATQGGGSIAWDTDGHLSERLCDATTDCGVADTRRECWEGSSRERPIQDNSRGWVSHPVDYKLSHAAALAETSWADGVLVPCVDPKRGTVLRRAPRDARVLDDGVPVDLVDALAEAGPPHRSVIAAIGNAIVPEVAYRILAAIAEEEERCERPSSTIRA